MRHIIPWLFLLGLLLLAWESMHEGTKSAPSSVTGITERR